MSGPAIARQLGMPASTVGGILRPLELGKLSVLEPRPLVVRYEPAQPGELIHIDTKKLGRITAVGHRTTGDRRDTRRGAVPQTGGRLVRAPGHERRAGDDG